MVLQAPHGFIYVVAAFLAMIGILATFPTSLSIPDLASEHAAWFIFLAWFMMAAGCMRPNSSKAKAEAAPAKGHAAPAHAPADEMMAEPMGEAAPEPAR